MKKIVFFLLIGLFSSLSWADTVAPRQFAWPIAEHLTEKASPVSSLSVSGTLLSAIQAASVALYYYDFKGALSGILGWDKTAPEQVKERSKEIRKSAQEIRDSYGQSSLSADNSTEALWEKHHELISKPIELGAQSKSSLEATSVGEKPGDIQAVGAAGVQTVAGMRMAPRGVGSNSEEARCDGAVANYEAHPEIPANNRRVQKFADAGWVKAKLALVKQELTELDQEYDSYWHQQQQLRQARAIDVSRVVQVDESLSQLGKRCAGLEHDIQTYQRYLAEGTVNFIDDSNIDDAAPAAVSQAIVRPAIEDVRTQVRAIVWHRINTLVSRRAELEALRANLTTWQAVNFLNDSITALNAENGQLRKTLKSQAEIGNRCAEFQQEGYILFKSTQLWQVAEHHTGVQAEMSQVRTAVVSFRVRDTDSEDHSLIYGAVARNFIQAHDQQLVAANPDLDRLRQRFLLLNEALHWVGLMRQFSSDPDHSISSSIMGDNMQLALQNYRTWFLQGPAAAPSNQLSDFVRLGRWLYNDLNGLNEAATQQRLNSVQINGQRMRRFFGGNQRIWVTPDGRYSVRLHRNSLTGRLDWTFGLLLQNPCDAGGNFIVNPNDPNFYLVQDPNNEIYKFSSDGILEIIAPAFPHRNGWQAGTTYSVKIQIMDLAHRHVQ